MEGGINENSIEKSRQSYQEIIGSFKNIHNKLEEWHKHRKDNDKGYGSLIEQQTANFENVGSEDKSENSQEQFLYEFEKQNNTIESTNIVTEGPKDYRPESTSLNEERTNDYDKENI